MPPQSRAGSPPDIGLPVEDEFSVACAWLGKCQLLHKLDQHQVPIALAEISGA
jgi:hypothetical protein